MSAIEAYVADLHAALNDRLPPSVATARLREARSHLLASATEVGEAEAIRRYGTARAVAGGLVRAHRGYGERSAWRLALPASAGLLVAANALPLPWTVVHGGVGAVAIWQGAWFAAWIVVAVVFAVRAAQTRRWLAVPMAAAHATGIAALVVVNHLWLAPAPWSAAELALASLYGLASTVAWTAVNAGALGVGRLLDARGTR